MHIGVDLDNTIVCYDRLFHQAAREREWIPADIPPRKTAVRNHLRRTGREAGWTALQGSVYGPRMREAEPYPGVLEFFFNCRRQGLPLAIISHKTRIPARGAPFDLHQAALTWLESHGFFDPAAIALPRASVFLELSREAKLDRIAQLRCTHFIDDLSEFLSDPLFPRGIQRILFDPHREHPESPSYRRVRDWAEAARLLIV